MSQLSKIILGLLATAGMAAFATAPAHAVGDHPFCMQGRAVPGLSDCSYATYKQCQDTASGRALWCIENPYYESSYRNDPRVSHGRNQFRSVAARYF
jgi:uncharacterized protein DUF3551